MHATQFILRRQMVEVSFTKGQVQSPIPQMGTEQMDDPTVDDCIQIGYLVIEPTVLFGVGLTGVGKEEARGIPMPASIP